LEELSALGTLERHVLEQLLVRVHPLEVPAQRVLKSHQRASGQKSSQEVRVDNLDGLGSY
jgi:hypothetical protein